MLERREVFLGRRVFGQRPRGNEDGSHLDIWGESIQSRRPASAKALRLVGLTGRARESLGLELSEQEEKR